jgi:hypothetical protein
MGLSEKIILFVVAIILVIALSSASFGRKDRTKYLKDRYEAALRGNDKAAAWGAGREYYTHLKGKRLSEKDEEVIASEVGMMGGDEDQGDQ